MFERPLNTVLTLEILSRLLVLPPTLFVCSASLASTRNSPEVPPPRSRLRASSVATRPSTLARTLPRLVRPPRYSHLQREYVEDVNVCCVAIIHVLAFLIGVGYAQNYYFHLRTLHSLAYSRMS